MSSLPAVPLVDLIYTPHAGNHQSAGRRRSRPTPDGQFEDHITPVHSVGAKRKRPSPTNIRPQHSSNGLQADTVYHHSRPGSPSSVTSYITLDSPKLLVIGQTGKATRQKTSGRPAPIISREANPGVRTIWDEDWPHHRTALGSDSADQSTRFIEPNVRDWAYRSPDQPPLHNSLRRAVSSSGLHGDLSPTASLATTEIPINMTRAVPSTDHQPPVTASPTAVSPRATEHVPFTNPSVASAIPVRHIRSSQQPTSTLENNTSPEHVTGDNNSSTRGVYHRSSLGGRDGAAQRQWGSDKYDEDDFIADDLKRTGTVTLKDSQHLGSRLFHKPQPIARNWSTMRKRFVATVTCLNTALVGILIGIYAGEVPAIQYTLADQHHRVILGNVVLYIAMGLVVFIFWPLPLLHGRRPYTLAALAVVLPLQIPQAVVIDQPRGTNYPRYTFGLLFARALSGFALGFLHINLISTLLDLFGASLQSANPHGEVVILSDVRRHGGGMGLWLGIWCWCYIGSLSLGFLIGADVISGINISWGFYISVILIACTLLLNVISPETRRARYRQTMQEVQVTGTANAQRVALGEIKMHVSGEGPRWWGEEVWAGIYLSIRMIMHTGFLIIALYVGWIYAEVVLVIVLLGNLLSAGYHWRPEFVGLGVFSIAIGALLAVPLSKANLFSRSRSRPPRTDSMTFQPRVTWTSHLVRRVLFMIALPIAGLAYTLASKGDSVQFMVPIVFAAVIGFMSNLAITECNGIIMETFDTSDLQPGSNSKHRLQSLPASDKQRRTAYSSYPRVSAGFFVSQSLGFLLAAAATGVGGIVTRQIGAQKATAITAGILFGLTLLLTAALWRYKNVQVTPNELFGYYFGSAARPGEASGPGVGTARDTADERRSSLASIRSDRSWRAVIIGNPSGKMRRMNWLELGSLSRWTEVRRLNRLLNRSTTQGLNPGWR